MTKIKDMTGEKINMLTVIDRAENSASGKAYWICKCDCGNITIVSSSNLRNGAVKSCGCLKHKKRETHHLSHTRIYRIWRSVIERCNGKNKFASKYYYEKGISVCDEWEKDFLAFYKWALENGYGEELTIDRIDNKKGYNPDNCRWVSRKVQSNNRVFCKVFEYNGKKQNLTQWCEELGLNYKRVHSRIFRLNWTFEQAISTPVCRKRKE